MNKPFQLGSISTGTLKTEDLLPKLTEIMRQYLTDNGHEALYVQQAEAIIGNGFVESDLELADELVGTLMDGIQGYCPPFVCFGAHPGDGADFGFWPDWDALEEACPEGQVEYRLEDCIVRWDGPNKAPTVMDLDRQILWSTV